MVLIRLLKKYKWWLTIGTLISIIFIASHFWQDFLLSFYLSFPLFFIVGCIAVLISKSDNVGQIFAGGVFTGIYGGFLYLLIYWVGYEIIVKKAWESPMFAYNWGLAILPPISCTIVSFIPMSIAGGLLVFVIRKIIAKKKSL